MRNSISFATRFGSLVLGFALLGATSVWCQDSTDHLIDPDLNTHNPNDTDGDGIPDSADACPTVANANELDFDRDGQPDYCDPDVDGDGVPNQSDLCPNVPDTSLSDIDGDWTGDACDIDMDGDGVLNEADACPQDADEECGQQDQIQTQEEPERDYGWGSCPYVYLWDGENWTYSTDLSGSVVGKGVPFFRPAFYGANIYRLGGFRDVRGVYRINLREVIQESSFFDEVRLLVVDVPEGHDVHTQWSFTSQLEREPDLEFLTVGAPRPPVTAVADDGSDVLAQVSEPDGVPLPVKEDTVSRVVVDFGPVEHPENARLVVTAWGYYADFTSTQRPPYSAGTTIETQDEDGQWQVRVVAGKAAGDSKTWIIDISGLVKADDTRLRITMAHQPTALDVLDMVRLDDAPPVEFHVSRIEPRRAVLGYGGTALVDFSSLEHRIQADGSRLPINPQALLDGRYTAYGDVRPLLGAADDRFVVMAHGDELALEFEAPPARPGTERYVFLEADVFYSLMYHPLRLLTTTIEPLPYHGMGRYPYDPASWPYAEDASYQEYLETWNTRLIQLPEPMREGQRAVK